MYILQMFLGKLLVDRSVIEYEGFTTCTERKEYLERVARELQGKHSDQISLAMLTPEFIVVGPESRLNEMYGIQAYNGQSDEDFVEELRSEFSDEFWIKKELYE